MVDLGSSVCIFMLIPFQFGLHDLCSIVFFYDGALVRRTVLTVVALILFGLCCVYPNKYFLGPPLTLVDSCLFVGLIA